MPDLIDSFSVKQLKEYITAQGGSHADCVEKSDLKARALQLKKSPTTKPSTTTTTTAVTAASTMRGGGGKDYDDDFADLDVSSSDDDEEEEPQQQQQHSAGGRRFSVFRAKKFMTSKLVSGTSTGRATIMKMLGRDGDEVVQALQSVCSKLTDTKTAKEMKKDVIRFLLKAYNLFKAKELALDDTKSIQSAGQQLGELFVREAGRTTNNLLVAPAARGPQSLASIASKVHDACVTVLTPHLQPRNRDRLSHLLKFFATADFYRALLTRADMDAEKRVLHQATSELLLPFPPLLAGERDKQKYDKLVVYLSALEQQRFDALLDTAQFLVPLQGMLELEMGLSPRHVLRFLKSVDDYEKTTSKSLMRDRAPKIAQKYLVAGGEFCVVDELADQNMVSQAVCEALDDQQCSLHTFERLVKELRRLLREDFYSQFVKSRDYSTLLAQVRKEKTQLEAVLVADGVM